MQTCCRAVEHSKSRVQGHQGRVQNPSANARYLNVILELVESHEGLWEEEECHNQAQVLDKKVLKMTCADQGPSSWRSSSCYCTLQDAVPSLVPPGSLSIITALKCYPQCSHSWPVQMERSLPPLFCSVIYVQLLLLISHHRITTCLHVSPTA